MVYVLPVTAVTFTIWIWLRITPLMMRPPLPPSREHDAVGPVAHEEVRAEGRIVRLVEVDELPGGDPRAADVRERDLRRALCVAAGPVGRVGAPRLGVAAPDQSFVPEKQIAALRLEQ